MKNTIYRTIVRKRSQEHFLVNTIYTSYEEADKKAKEWAGGDDLHVLVRKEVNGRIKVIWPYLGMNKQTETTEGEASC